MPETMNSVERTWTVLHGGIPDRVPVDLHNFLMTAQASGIYFPDFLQNGEAMAEGQIKAWREFGHDVLLLENGTAALAQACGCEVEYLDKSSPVVVSPVLKSLDDLDQLQIPDPYKAHPLSTLLKGTQIVAREIGKQAFIIGRADQGPFALAGLLLGMEEFLLQIAFNEKPEQIHRLLEFCLETTYRFAVAQIEQGAQMTSFGESLAGPDVCSPKAYMEYEWGYAKQLVDRLKSHEILLAYHICGNATRIVPKMVETGAAVLELDYKVDLVKAKQAIQGRSTFLGPIEPSGVMALGTPELVTEKCKEAIEILAPGGGFILGPGCALPASTPPENVHAMLEAAYRFGRY
jgi:MtaA/CmuA family methyltransferase